MLSLLVRDREIIAGDIEIPPKILQLFNDIASLYLIIPENDLIFWDTVRAVFEMVGDVSFSESNDTEKIASIIDDENQRILEELFFAQQCSDSMINNVIILYRRRYGKVLYNAVENVLCDFAHLWATENSWIQHGQSCLYPELI